MKTTGIPLVLILLAGSLVVPIGFSEAQVSDLTVPNAPTNLNATAVSDSQINLSWTAPVNSTADQVNGYMIEIRPFCTGSFITLVANTTSTSTTYSNTGLASGICYEYRASAINPVGTGNPSNLASATTWSVPSAPLSLTANATSSSQINLNWTAPSNPGGTPVNGYKVERRNGCTGSFASLVANTSNTNTAYSDMGLVNGTCYEYRIFAHNMVGTSVASNNAAATTLQNPIPITTSPPSAPTGLTVTVLSSTALKLTWNPPSDLGGAPITGYQIQRNCTTIVNNTGTSQTNFTNIGLLPVHQQTYRVAAWNSAGLGPYSSNATGTTSNATGTTGNQTSTQTSISNLGQLVSDFVHQRNAILKQQRNETLQVIKECNENLKNASPENRMQIKDDCKAALKTIKEKYKDARKQFKEQFKTFRETAKSLIKEAKKLNEIDKEGIKDFKGELKSFDNETKKEEKSFNKELKSEEKQFKKGLKELKKEAKKAKKDKHHDEEDD